MLPKPWMVAKPPPLNLIMKKVLIIWEKPTIGRPLIVEIWNSKDEEKALNRLHELRLKFRGDYYYYMNEKEVLN